MCAYEVLARFPGQQVCCWPCSFITVWLHRPWGARFFSGMIGEYGEEPIKSRAPLNWPAFGTVMYYHMSGWVLKAVGTVFGVVSAYPDCASGVALCFVCATFTRSASLFMSSCLFRSNVSWLQTRQGGIHFISVLHHWTGALNSFSAVPETSSHLILQSEAKGWERGGEEKRERERERERPSVTPHTLGDAHSLSLFTLLSPITSPPPLSTDPHL